MRLYPEKNREKILEKAEAKGRVEACDDVASEGVYCRGFCERQRAPCREDEDALSA